MASYSTAQRQNKFNKLRSDEIGKELWKGIIGQEEIVQTVMDELELTNTLQVPRIQKIFLSAGPQDGVSPTQIAKYVEQITGQRAVITKARTSIARYKVRKGMDSGVKVSLTGKNMYNFFNMFKYALLDYRDFEAVNMNSINQTKNSCQLNIGLKHIGFFKQMPYLGTGVKIGLTITIVSKCGTHTALDKNAFALFLYYAGLPIEQVIEGRISQGGK